MRRTPKPATLRDMRGADLDVRTRGIALEGRARVIRAPPRRPASNLYMNDYNKEDK